MNNKTLALVSYITLIGWLVSFFSSKDNRDPLVKYHLKQSFGLFIVGLVLNIGLRILAAAVPALALLSLIVGVFFLILIIIGIVNANKGQSKPLPLIGKMFEGKFGFI